jgi:exodeoxyribonuclease VII small subunit
MNQSPEPASFEDSLAELEAVLRTLEDGTTGLEEALACYERGVGLLKRCYGQLRHAEQRVVQLAGSDDEGRPVLAPFEHTTSAADVERADAKRKRRPSPGEAPF